ncbi:FAD-dependent monooxygenase [Microbacterium pumilum]|uniref:FAD-dependent monooxygenase n=2 Tax=Microbacterium pumilum TaxID=344165 RepID=A0ABN2T185_9MICO
MGAGPAGMATALSIAQTEHDVIMLERYPAARPAGNILNLWPPPIKALRLMGVDTVDLGAPCQSEFRSASGRVRAVVHLPQDVIDQYGGGFIGMLRPQLYSRMLASIPEGILRTNTQVTSFDQDESGVRLDLADGSTLEADLLVGADGIDSLVRRTLWGDAPKREHNLHIIGGFTFDDTLDVPTGRCVVSHTRTIQGSWTSIRHEGRAGFQWWVLGAFDSSKEFAGDLQATATKMAEGFASPLPQLVAATDPGSLQRWPIRDRPPLEKWSKGRATLVGDAAHPTSPYAAYGAGMSIEDGFFLGRRVAGVDISDAGALTAALEKYEAPRRAHTAFQVDIAYKLGKIFHHIPAPVRPIRDLFFDHSPFLQKMIGDGTPGEILKQLDEIDDAEREFQSRRGASTSA